MAFPIQKLSLFFTLLNMCIWFNYLKIPIHENVKNNYQNDSTVTTLSLLFQTFSRGGEEEALPPQYVLDLSWIGLTMVKLNAIQVFFTLCTYVGYSRNFTI